jgi:hypothetical protein
MSADLYDCFLILVNLGFLGLWMAIGSGKFR